MNTTPIQSNTTWFTIWLSEDYLTKLIDVLLVAGLVGFTLFCVVQFVKALQLRPVSIKRKDTTIQFQNDKNNLLPNKSGSLDLINHKVFRLLVNTQTMQFYHKTTPITNKDLINFSFLQNCVFPSFNEELSSYIKEMERRKGANLSEFPEVLNRIINKYQHRANDIEIELIDERTLKGIPTIYIKKFNDWNSEHMKMCKQGINDTLVDTYYLTWDIRASTCLEYIYMIINMIITDAEESLEQMNGDLSKCIDDMIASDHNILC